MTQHDDYNRRAMLRRQRDAARSAHMQQLHDDATARNQPRRSDTIPAKWYPDMGPKVAGLALHGMIYAGKNASLGQLCRPDVPVVSLIDPTKGVRLPKPGERVPMLQHDATYAGMSSTQRGKFLQFLASDMTSADTDDIGYAFLYLYGLERRLVIDVDAGNVTAAERRRVCLEVLRLDREFRGISESFHEYAMALILYDGSIVRNLLSRHDDDTDALVNMKPMLRGNVAACGRRQHVARLLAYEYMLLSRMVSCGVTIPLVNVAAYAVLSMLYGMRDPNEAPSALAGTNVWDLVRLAGRRMRRAGITSQQAIERNMRVAMPRRRTMGVRYVAACSRIESRVPAFGTRESRFGDGWMRGFPLADMSRIAVESYESVARLMACTSAKALRADVIDGIDSDAILCVSKPEAMGEFAMGNARDGILVVPPDTMRAATREVFHDGLPKTMSQTMQSAYAKVLTTYGYCPISDAVNAGIGVSPKPKPSLDDDVIAFRVPVAYDQNDGVQRAVMPPDGMLPDCARILDAAWCYGWFASRCGGTVSRDEMPYRALGIVPSDTTETMHTMMAAYAYAVAGGRKAASTKSYRPTREMQALGAGTMQAVMFAYAHRKFGALIPQAAMAAMEDAYSRMGLDKSLVLYDYQAFDDTRFGARRGDGGIELDASLLSHMMSDTSEIQDIISESLGDDDVRTDRAAEGTHGDTAGGGMAPVADGSAGDAGIAAGATQADDGGGRAATVAQAIIDAFGGDDEMQVGALLQAVVAAAGGDGMTNAQAMGLVAEANEWYESRHDEALVDIDGPLALLEI